MPDRDTILETGGESPSASRVLDCDRLQSVCGNDPEFEHTLLTTYLETTVETLWQARTAIENDDADSLRHYAHGVKGSSQLIGAEALAEVCLELETIGRSGDLTNAPAAIDQADRAYKRVRRAIKPLLHPKAA